MKSILAHSQNLVHPGPGKDKMMGDKNPHGLFGKSHCDHSPHVQTVAIELENTFTVPVPPAQAWDVLLDVERIAPCMPGASVLAVNGNEIEGQVKVKLGPLSLTY
jgi:hypothetical protein